MTTTRSAAVNTASGKVANRYLLCSVAGRAARGLQVTGKLSSQAITEALHLVGKGEVIRTKAVKLPMAA
jgi:hypothetical protein